MRIIVCSATKPPNEEAIQYLEPCEKSKAKGIYPASRKEPGSYEEKHRVTTSWIEMKNIPRQSSRRRIELSTHQRNQGQGSIQPIMEL